MMAPFHEKFAQIFKQLSWLNMEATKRPFGYLFIDLKQNTGPFIYPIPGRFAPESESIRPT
jgi:hypothetical protein